MQVAWLTVDGIIMSLANRGFPLTIYLDDMATSSYLRRMNQRRIIEAVVRVRRVSRAELACR
jgi:hypothetical protein